MASEQLLKIQPERQDGRLRLTLRPQHHQPSRNLPQTAHYFLFDVNTKGLQGINHLLALKFCPEFNGWELWPSKFPQRRGNANTPMLVPGISSSCPTFPSSVLTHTLSRNSFSATTAHFPSFLLYALFLHPIPFQFLLLLHQLSFLHQVWVNVSPLYLITCGWCGQYWFEAMLR